MITRVVCVSFLLTVLQCSGLSVERFMQQSLDHFDPQNRELWQMRYFANEAYFQDGGSIFIYVGGDFQVGTFWLEHGHMHDIARDLNGLIIGTETRFFGMNQPSDDTSTSNLRFLSTEQILADTARLIDHIKSEDQRLVNAKVILVGTLFGANIATWFRIKYPHHSDGVWSSSSYVEARLNFREYFELIGADIQNFGSVDCDRRVWRAFRTMENLIDGGRSTVLDEMFNHCHPLNASSILEVERFFGEITESVSMDIINGGSSFARFMCTRIMNPDITNDLTAFADWFMIDHPGQCFGQTFEDIVDFLSAPQWNALGVLSGRRQYQYLLCTEFGWFPTTDSGNQPFGTRISLNYFTELCRRVFGDWISAELIEENTARTNVIFGGAQPVITNAFFTNGGMDPHRLTNVQSDIGETVEAQTLPLYGHSADMDSQSVEDSPMVRNAKVRARELVTQWVD